MTSSARILPNISQIEKHLVYFRTILSKAQYKVFKPIMTALVTGRAKSCLEISRTQGVGYHRLSYFFNESIFDEEVILKQSIEQI